MFYRHIVILFVVLMLAACSRAPKLAPLPAGSTVLAFGDSVTYGTGASQGEDWPTLLAGMTGWRIVNAGIPGDTAEAGKGRIKALLDEHRPVVVIVEIGGNDFLRGRPQKAVKDDLRAILATIRQSGATVVLVAVPQPSLMAAVAKRPSDAAIYAELGKEEKLPVIADVFSNVLAQADLRADAIHPNARGYREMAGGLLAALKKIGLYTN
ncbi:MAG: arylesterase [Burkholderiaceae bacterium]|nr:arylesterase [Burkholderiaceae bacterium]